MPPPGTRRGEAATNEATTVFTTKDTKFKNNISEPFVAFVSFVVNKNA